MMELSPDHPEEGNQDTYVAPGTWSEELKSTRMPDERAAVKSD